MKRPADNGDVHVCVICLEEELSREYEVPPLRSLATRTLLGWGHEAQNELSTFYCCGAPVHCLCFKEYIQHTGIAEDENTLVFYIHYRCPHCRREMMVPSFRDK